MVSIDRVLSEFIDDWNAGRRPQVDEYLERVPEPERAELADQLMTWLEVAPTPTYAYPLPSGNTIYIKDQNSLIAWEVK